MRADKAAWWWATADLVFVHVDLDKVDKRKLGLHRRKPRPNHLAWPAPVPATLAVERCHRTDRGVWAAHHVAVKSTATSFPEGLLMEALKASGVSS